MSFFSRTYSKKPLLKKYVISESFILFIDDEIKLEFWDEKNKNSEFINWAFYVQLTTEGIL